MEDAQQPLFTGKLMGLILILSVGFHLFMSSVLVNHVPSDSAFWQWLWAIFAATPLTGTFFLAASMFSLVLRDQLHGKRSA